MFTNVSHIIVSLDKNNSAAIFWSMSNPQKIIRTEFSVALFSKKLNICESYDIKFYRIHKNVWSWQDGGEARGPFDSLVDAVDDAWSFFDFEKL